MGYKRTHYFQWVDGELKGNVTTLKQISEFDGEYFYELDDGEICNLRLVAPMTNNPDDIKNKFLVEIFSPAYAWKLETIGTHKATVYDAERGEITVDVPPIEDVIKAGGQQEVELTDSALGKTKIVPPPRCPSLEPLPNVFDYLVGGQTDDVTPETPENESETENKQTNQSERKSVSNKTKTADKTVSTDAVQILVDSCKKHETSITMTVNIDLPKKSVYMMAEEEFENGGERFIEYLTENINTNKIIEALKVALVSAYTKKKETA